MTTKTLDVKEIARRRRDGHESLAAIASDFGVSRERIRQVLVAEYGTTWAETRPAALASEREKQIAAWREQMLDELEAGKPVTRERVVDDCPARVTSVEEVLGEYAWAVPFPQATNTQYTDADMFKAMKRVWSKHVKPDVLTRNSYDAHRGPDDVSGARIIQRMSWAEACDKAGVPAGVARRASYTRLSENVAVDWVAAFLADALAEGTSMAAGAYDVWARKHGGPSMGGIRLVTGSWNDARVAATPEVVAWQRGHSSKPPLPGASGTTQYTRAEIAEWRAARKADPKVSIKELAERFDVADSTLRYHLEP